MITYKVEKRDDKTFLKAEGEWPNTEQEALEESIKKWEAILELGPEFDGAGETCALCSWNIIYGCEDCIIAKITGQYLCFGTPYQKAIDDRNKDGSMKVKHIKAEIEFLKNTRKEIKLHDKENK